jgi:hypothetical protein
MSTLHIASQGYMRKRLKEKVAAAQERINKRTIVIEREVLKLDIRVAPFDLSIRDFRRTSG